MTKKELSKRLKAALERCRERAMNGHRRRVAEMNYRLDRERFESLNLAMKQMIGLEVE